MTEKNKFQKFKEAIKNPSPDKLAKIEYRSHLFQAIGITFVCGFLIYKGFWYIIFAFMFGVGISYSQGMGAYMKYKAIRQYMPKEKPQEYIDDISWTRRREKIISYIYGGWIKWVVLFVCVVESYLLIDLYLINHIFSWARYLLYPTFILIFYILQYYLVIYWAAKPTYDSRTKDLKGEPQ